VTRPVIPAERYASRLEAAQQALPAEDAAALLVGVGADLQWLTGYGAKDLERLTMLIVPAAGRATLVVPRLERAAAETPTAVQAKLVDVVTWEETEDPFELVAARLDASDSRPEIQLGALGGAWGRLGGLLVSDRLWATFLLRLQSAVPDAAFGLASAVLGPLRAVKDVDEIALLREAAHAADRVVQQIAKGRLIGRSEAQVAREVRDRLVDEGHDFASFWIIASGPNGASPHHEPTDRVIEAGEPIVVDIGGSLSGYCSDITRTLWVTGDVNIRPTDEYVHLYEVLQRAQAAATAAVRPGAAPGARPPGAGRTAQPPVGPRTPPRCGTGDSGRRCFPPGWPGRCPSSSRSPPARTAPAAAGSPRTPGRQAKWPRSPTGLWCRRFRR